MATLHSIHKWRTRHASYYSTQRANIGSYISTTNAELKDKTWCCGTVPFMSHLKVVYMLRTWARWSLLWSCSPSAKFGKMKSEVFLVLFHCQAFLRPLLDKKVASDIAKCASTDKDMRGLCDNGKIFFNHLTKLEEEPDKKTLQKGFHRGMAFFLPDDHPGADILCGFPARRCPFWPSKSKTGRGIHTQRSSERKRDPPSKWHRRPQDSTPFLVWPWPCDTATMARKLTMSGSFTRKCLVMDQPASNGQLNTRASYFWRLVLMKASTQE